MNNKIKWYKLEDERVFSVLSTFSLVIGIIPAHIHGLMMGIRARTTTWERAKSANPVLFLPIASILATASF